MYANLDIHNEILSILHFPFNGTEQMRTLFKNCYLLLRIFCLLNKRNQEILSAHLDHFISQMGVKLNVSETIEAVLNNNPVLAAKIDQSFLRQWMRLFREVGKKRAYLIPLDHLLHGDIPSSTLLIIQTLVIDEIKASGSQVLLFIYSLKLKQ